MTNHTPESAVHSGSPDATGDLAPASSSPTLGDRTDQADPSGFASPGRTWITEGFIADDRSPLVKTYRSQFRRPTKDEQAA